MCSSSVLSLRSPESLGVVESATNNLASRDLTLSNILLVQDSEMVGQDSFPNAKDAAVDGAEEAVKPA